MVGLHIVGLPRSRLEPSRESYNVPVPHCGLMALLLRRTTAAVLKRVDSRHTSGSSGSGYGIPLSSAKNETKRGISREYLGCCLVLTFSLCAVTFLLACARRLLGSFKLFGALWSIGFGGLAGEHSLGFIHIPKSGGTSLWEHIYTSAQRVGLRPYVRINHTEDPPWHMVNQSVREATDIFGSDHANYYQLLQSWPKGSLNETIFVTLFRHPVDRLVSHYYFVKRDTWHHSYPIIINHTFAEILEHVNDGYSLQFFVDPETVDGGIRNLDGFEFRPCCFNRTHLEAAKTLLRDRFSVVGVLEEIEKTRDVLECRVPWIKHQPIGKKMATKHSRPDYDKEAMRRATELDVEFYNFAKELLHQSYRDCATATV